jgi:hypothetical protein
MATPILNIRDVMINPTVETVIEKFDEILATILRFLGYNTEPSYNKIKGELISLMRQLNTQKKIEFVNNFQDMYSKLVEKDYQFQQFSYANVEFENITIGMKEQLAKLQVMSLLKAINTKDCDIVIKAFTNAVNNKLKTVNQVLEENIKQVGGSKQNIKRYIVNYLF